jgi:NAD(P)-dependent dehydrogenase (short-subunit alcohol dehydrogenase family)
MRDWPSPVTDVASDRGPARRAEKAKTEKEAEDGLETTFALNHMAYFVATRGLRDVASAPARVVSTASAAHRGATVDFDDLQLAKTFGPMKAYGPFGALQHSLHARTRPPSTRHGRDRQLPASRLRPE